MKIKWNKLAVKQLIDAIDYLDNNQLSSYAEKIEKRILLKISALGNEQYLQTEQQQENTPKNVRILQVDRYLIAYRKTLNSIKILRFFSN
ncbi:type II toxin-antitoxin system RelE/ParE family toxin [Pedobacter foliorum]|uniref:type II toxin-antitoxin system RelE/ParE family toxin n=1 Tax=Pedobacter foliorum TaxID=2739058 RepID=UPI00156486BE|nr:type II toxin-antitoxin system RelE/ParE family toxin [Pedobacter foliorum]NRF37479.1 type II toxin-antitoxin system RelE/ParE family toxin [Pedobacter foliorum]